MLSMHVWLKMPTEDGRQYQPPGTPSWAQYYQMLCFFKRGLKSTFR